MFFGPFDGELTKNDGKPASLHLNTFRDVGRPRCAGKIARLSGQQSKLRAERAFQSRFGSKSNQACPPMRKAVNPSIDCKRRRRRRHSVPLIFYYRSTMADTQYYNQRERILFA